MKDGLRAIGYGRVSTEEQEKGTSLRDQYEGNHAKADAVGAVMVAYFGDKDSGGFYLTRKGLQAALQTLEEGRANALIVKDLVRLTRNDRSEQAMILKRIKDAGARIIFWDVVYENSPMGDFALNVTGDFAILEKAVIRDRTMKGRLRRAREGQMPCRTHAPFGYILPKKDDITRGVYPPDQLGKYLLHPVNHKIAAEIFHRVAAGESLHGVTRWIQASGVPTSSGGKFWRLSNLQSILNNHAYYGSATFGRERTVTDETRMLQGFKTRSYEVAVPEEDWIRIPCPAIVTKEVWDRCQQRIRQSRERLSTRITRRQLLTGMLRCPRCHRVMTGRGYSRNMVSHYKCKEASPSSNSQGFACWNKHINIKQVDPLVIEAVKLVVTNPSAVEQAFYLYYESLTRAFSEEEYQALKRQLSALDREERNTAKAQIQAISVGIDTAVYEGILKELALKRTGVQRRLDALEEARHSLQPVDDKASLIQQAMQDAAEVLDAADTVISVPQKNEVLHKIIEHIYPSEDGHQFIITFAASDEMSRLVAVVGRDQATHFSVSELEEPGQIILSE